ncbi:MULTISPECIES: acetyl-CoA C-acyltransferase [Shouchella]|uniref:acetyl-CoA C-acyltransferase n=1 Tax=Shouchella hunanensis TaxID=766894 RepID=A0ABY7W097_9BACI|nr:MULTISPECIES: acetyl-CoA C-acyltransferase [Shouchella]WDF02357.1 acetyl-CoA C-acyltransferase [Shouchella hunanensis]
MKEVVIVDAVRTPIGRYKGSLKNVRPDDLGAIVIKALIERNSSLDPSTIEEVVMGNANGAGEDNRNVARMSTLLAGLPEEVAGTTINRLCGSGLDAILYAARCIAIGDGDVFIAGGTESMTRAPYVMAKPEVDFPRGPMELLDTTIGWRFTNRLLDETYGTDSMPKTAETVAERYKISRERQDEFALMSQERAQRALTSNRFADEQIPVCSKNHKGQLITVKEDEHPRARTTIQTLQQLKPLFPNGTVTAGNASGINDGASAVLLMSAEKARALKLTPIARYRSGGVAGVEPAVMGIGPITATKKALVRAGLKMEDIGLTELNEAFAAQTLACINELQLDPNKVNVNGGAIALGHPLGASGARLVTTLVHEMKRSNVQYGLATMCVGVGQGIAAVFERMEG